MNRDDDVKTRQDIANEKKMVAWQNELIRVGQPGDPSSIRRIPRRRLTVQNVNKSFALIRGVYFLRDEQDTVVWPEDWTINLRPAPMLYIIAEKPMPPPVEDVLDHLLYDGGTALLARQVPEEVTDAMG